MEAETHKQGGHRERLKARFVRGAEEARGDEALLELLLTYAIPQKDVQPLARQLLATFGSLEGVLAAAPAELARQEGIKEHTAILLKVVDHISMQRSQNHTAVGARPQPQEVTAAPLFPALMESRTMSAPLNGKARPATNQGQVPTAAGLVTNALLEESITLLPIIPDTSSLEAIRQFLQQHLPFNSATTRTRTSRYVISRMFPAGVVDQGFLRFARAYAGQRAWREACFYRFCKAEPLMYEVIEDFIRPALGVGQMPRHAVRQYLDQRFPGMPSTKHAALAVVEALVSGELAKADRETLYIGYREPTPAGFAFVLQSEFPEPGMFKIASLEQNRALRAMLWQPASLLPMLYELRNKQIISAVSEIDALRQFTIRYSFEQACEVLAQARI